MFDDMVKTVAYPVYLDDHPEMQVGIMLINVDYLPEFDVCPPVRTHTHSCDKHGKHLDHYSIPSSGKQLGIEIHIDIKPRVPRG